MRTDCITRNQGNTRDGTTAQTVSTKTSVCSLIIVWDETDSEARKGKRVSWDHAPLVIDIDSRGRLFDADWTSAESHIAARLWK